MYCVTFQVEVSLPKMRAFSSQKRLSIQCLIACQLFMNSIFQTASRFVLGQKHVMNNFLQVRTKMKSHHAAAKRFIKTADGFKRKQAGRKHGNGGFTPRSLRHLDLWVPVTNKGGHLKKLEKFIDN